MISTCLICRGMAEISQWSGMLCAYGTILFCWCRCLKHQDTTCGMVRWLVVYRCFFYNRFFSGDCLRKGKLKLKIAPLPFFSFFPFQDGCLAAWLTRSHNELIIICIFTFILEFTGLSLNILLLALIFLMSLLYFLVSSRRKM